MSTTTMHPSSVATQTDEQAIDHSAKLDGILAVIQSGGARFDDLAILTKAFASNPRKFWFEFLRVAGKCSSRRDAIVRHLLNQITPGLRSILPDVYPTLGPAECDGLIGTLANRIEGYDGPLDLDAFTEWALRDVVHPAAESLRKSKIMHAQHLKRFDEIYAQGHRAAYAGVWDVLKHCHDLGADESTADFVVQISLLKVFLDVDNWGESTTASISTRLRKFSRAQALGWRTARLDERERLTDLSAADTRVWAKSNRRPAQP